MKRITVVGFIVLGILMLPIALSIAVNEVRLFNFTAQLQKTESLFSGPVKVLREDSTIFVGGNGELCGYRSMIVFDNSSYGLEMESVRRDFQSILFTPARSGGHSRNIDAYLDVSDSEIIITIEDGPYDAGFDLRCW